VAWVRRVRTGSGATAVQIMESVNGKRRVVQHIGSARGDAELGLLITKARELLDNDRQGQLDLGLAPMTVRAKLLPPPSLTLLPDYDEDREIIPQIVRMPTVLKTSSRLLYDAISWVYSDVGFQVLADDTFRDLVIARIVEPTSLLDADRVLADLGRVSASLSTRKRTLARCQSGDYRDFLARQCFTYAQASGDISLILYDVTTLWFEAEKEDDLRKIGYSKERRVDPQIIVGLLVDRTGFPLEISCWEGNKAETQTIIPTIETFRARHNIENLVIAADAGMLSETNLTKLDEAGYRFIVGSRATKAPIDLESHFRWHGNAFKDGQIIDTITPRRGKNTDNNKLVRSEPVWDPDQYPTSWRAVWAYSQKRANRDLVTLTAQENRARSVVNGDKATRATRFVKIKGDARTLDQTAIDRARQVIGLKGYVTNIPAPLMPPAEVIAHYHDLWNVEASFRMSKHDLQARPLFARTRDAIEAHITIVFAALAISRTIQQRTGISIRQFIRTLRPLRAATIDINGTTQVIPAAINEGAKTILDSLKTPNPGH